MFSLIAPLFNFLILVGILFYFLREPLAAFVGQRHETMSQAVKKVRQMLLEAQEQHDDFTAKLKAIDVEVAALREQSLQDAQAAKQRIVSEAGRMSGVIATDARMAADNVFADLRTRLRTELALRVLGRVEVLVKDRLTGDDRVKIRQEFSSQVESVQ